MIRWAEQAAEQLEQIYDCIALSDSEELAAEITKRIVESVERLATFPTSGRPGRVQGTRELAIVKTPFLAAYTIEKGQVVILAIYHGAQLWPKAF
jgi:addiction module RelE/StbE family toxin